MCEIDFTHSQPFIQLHGIFVYKILNYFILCNKNIFVKSRLIAQVFRNLKSVMGFSFLATKFKLCLFWCLILSLSLNHFIFQMSGLGMPLPSGQSPMPFASQDSNTAGNSNHSGDGLLIPDPSPEKPVTTARTPTERKRKRKTATQNQPNAAGTPANPNLMSTAPIGIEIRI